ncbi:MAG TPA: MFS transporter, partial [Candidatus Angelobacter sp.]|nr:MFS transporter [Candidatus Angelobacter sp.]
MRDATQPEDNRDTPPGMQTNGRALDTMENRSASQATKIVNQHVTAPNGRPSGIQSFSHAWRALRHRNFKLFFFGQSISVIGTWMTRLATSWLVYRLTHSALLLGVVSFAGQIVSFLLGPFAGVWVERLNRRKLLVWTQALAAVQSLALAALTLSHRINLWEIIALTAMQGLINAFDMPGRQSFLVQMVEDRSDLSNAIAINSSMANGARLIGPSIAGLVIAWAGEGWCFLLDGFSYFAVIASLLMMRIKPIEMRRSASTMLEQMREGWDYVRTFRPIRTILLLFALTSLMGYPYAVLMPVFAGQVLHGGAHTLGWLTGASGIGALTSALSLAVRKSVVGLTRMVQIAAVTLGSGLILFGLSRTLWLSLVLMVFVGFGLMQCASASNTIVQALVTEDKRARVMSYYTMAFFGAAPFGSLLAGALAHQIGAPHTIMITGACCIFGSLWFTLELPKIRKVMRPIYQEMGLLPVKQIDPIVDEV